MTQTFADVAHVKPVPEITDDASLTAETFFQASARGPVVLRRMGRRTRAFAKWTDEFMLTLGDESVSVRCDMALSSGRLATWRAEMKLRDFIENVKTHQGLYLDEWYLFRRYPELLPDVVDGLPGYLADDWFELIPARWASVLSPENRNSLYWGADQSRTELHWDSLDAVTWNLTLRGTKRWLLFDAAAFNTHDQKSAMDRLRRAGLVDEHGFVGVDALQRRSSDDGLPLTFYSSEVHAGDLIFIPARWAHQVHNIGECLAVSRYYLCATNFDRCIAFVKAAYGAVPSAALRLLVGGATRREVLRHRGVRRFLASEPCVRAARLMKSCRRG